MTDAERQLQALTEAVEQLRAEVAALRSEVKEGRSRPVFQCRDCSQELGRNWVNCSTCREAVRA